jgi:hypothetical protein
MIEVYDQKQLNDQWLWLECFKFCYDHSTYKNRPIDAEWENGVVDVIGTATCLFEETRKRAK